MVDSTSHRFADIVDRTREAEQLTAFLKSGRRAGRALVITGHRGFGRSTLLNAAGAAADELGMRVVQVEPQPEQVPDAIRALSSELAKGRIDDAWGRDTLMAGNQLLQILNAASTIQPLLLTLDDADGLDESSASTLAFAARRLSSTRASLLITALPDEHSGWHRRGVPSVPVTRLTRADAIELLSRTYPDVDPAVAQRICDEASGSPRALLELAGALTTPQRTGHADLPNVLPFTNTMRLMYAPALAPLSREAFRLLCTIAAAREGDLKALTAAQRVALNLAHHPEAPEGSSSLVELEDQRLVGVEAGAASVWLIDPLVRNAVADAARPNGLREAHRRLAEVLDDPTRTWHRAAAANGPDPTIAKDLEDLANLLGHRGDIAQAVQLLLAAAHLSEPGTRRQERVAAAAHLRARHMGEFSNATHMLEGAEEPKDGSTPQALSTAMATAMLSLAGGKHLEEVRQLLVRALRHLVAQGNPSTAGPSDVTAALGLLMQMTLSLARPDCWTDYQELAESLTTPAEAPLLKHLSAVLPDCTRISPDALLDLDAAIEDVASLEDPMEVISIGVAAFQLDRLGPCRASLSRIADDGRRGKSVVVAGEAMLRLALDDCFTGQLEDAKIRAEEGRTLWASVHPDAHFWPFDYCLAFVAALRGEMPQVSALTDQMTAWAVPRGAALVEHYCAQVRALAAAGVRDFETAYQHAASISPLGSLDGCTAVALAASVDLVEAAVHTGRGTEASAHVDALLRANTSRLSPRFALHMATCQALAAPDAQTSAYFIEALSIPHVERWPFDKARAQLAYGDRLRRLRAPAEAHGHLWSAHETFRRLGADPWRKRSAQALRASGSPVDDEGTREPIELSERDQHIAMLAAAGLTNQEIGAQLFLSPRTVGSRLYRIFPKLGISSRAALRDALATFDLDKTRGASASGATRPEIASGSNTDDSPEL